MICPFGGDDCAQCPYWPHCRIARDEAWNSHPDRWRDFTNATEEGAQ